MSYPGPLTVRGRRGWKRGPTLDKWAPFPLGAFPQTPYLLLHEAAFLVTG
jgi:hypothetical protein